MKKVTIILIVLLAIGGVTYSLSGGKISVDPEFDKAMDLAHQIQKERLEKSEEVPDTHKVLSQMRKLDTATEPSVKKKSLHEENFFFKKLPESGGSSNSLIALLRSRMNGAKEGRFDFLYSPFEGEGIITPEMLAKNSSYRIVVVGNKCQLFTLHLATGKTVQVKDTTEQQKILARLDKIVS